MKTFLVALLLLLVSVGVYAQDSHSISGSDSSSNANSSPHQSQNANATNSFSYDVSSPASTQTQDSTKAREVDTVKTNPGMAYEAGGVAYSLYNCASSTGMGGSSWWASLTWSGTKESWACNFRANAALQAQVDATPNASQTAHDDMSMAQYVTCTTASRKVLKACMQLGLVINADTPVSTTADTWHACHANRQVFELCKQNALVSGRDTFDMKQ